MHPIKIENAVNLPDQMIGRHNLIEIIIDRFPRITS
jgi:hypothetical protein